MRKNCKECPWQNENQHSLKFRTYVEKMQSMGKIESHKCHMISSDVWGYHSNVEDKKLIAYITDTYEQSSAAKTNQDITAKIYFTTLGDVIRLLNLNNKVN